MTTALVHPPTPHVTPLPFSCFSHCSLVACLLFTACNIQLLSLDLHPPSNRSAARCGLGQWEKAKEDADRAVALEPSWPKGYCRKAAALVGMGQAGEGLKVYKQALAIDPNYAAAKQVSCIWSTFSLCKCQARGSCIFNWQS